MFFQILDFFGDIMSYLFGLMNHSRIADALGIPLPVALLAVWFSGTLIYVFCMRPASGLTGTLIRVKDNAKEPEARQLVTRRERSGSSVHTVTSDARSGLVLEERWLFND